MTLPASVCLSFRHVFYACRVNPSVLAGVTTKTGMGNVNMRYEMNPPERFLVRRVFVCGYALQHSHYISTPFLETLFGARLSKKSLKVKFLKKLFSVIFILCRFCYIFHAPFFRKDKNQFAHTILSF